ncbi:MAG: hypothetical protein AAGI17_10235 [Planctomycetota bacterium]
MSENARLNTSPERRGDRQDLRGPTGWKLVPLGGVLIDRDQFIACCSAIRA